MQDPKKDILDRLKTANTVLVTVSTNPSVDQLAALIGLSLIVNKLNKHGSAVFSGTVPSTIEFLKPKDSIETNTDSLRDFIISLDKNKADKLRYKVEDKVVKIFITPYKTSLSEKDLIFSQGDFNVELVLALGVTNQKDIDQAITSHGRILHDATVATINTINKSELGNINWTDPQASSLCEIVYELAKSLEASVMNEQIATALLTGIVSETDRFSNKKTTPRTMAVSGELMAAGADQQLVTNSLKAPVKNVNNIDTLNISHTNDLESKVKSELGVAPVAAVPLPAPKPVIPPAISNPPVSPPRTEPNLPVLDPATLDPNYRDPDLYVGPDSKFMTEPPKNNSKLTANIAPEAYDPSTDPLSKLSNDLSLGTDGPDDQKKIIQPSQGFTPPPTNWSPPVDLVINTPAEPGVTTSLPVPQSAQNTHIDNAREMVNSALNSTPANSPLEPIKALNAMPLGDSLHPNPVIPDNTQTVTTSAPPVPPPISFDTPDNQNK